MLKNGLIIKSLLLLFAFAFISSCSTVQVRKYSSKKRVSNQRKTTKLEHVSTFVDAQRNMVVAEAKKYLGVPYKYGGKSPHTGFDCSGLLTYVFNKTGIGLSGSSSQMAKKGRMTSTGQCKKGDLAFFGTNGKVTHVALIESVDQHSFKLLHSTSSKGVRIDDMRKSEYWQKKYLFSRSIIH